MSQTKASSAIEAAGSEGTEPRPTRCKRILLVEGDGFTRLVLLLRLRLAGFAVDFTSNGIIGLQKLRSCRPDILLVELHLCGLSGLDLIKAARAEPTFDDRPIYVFTRADRMNRASSKAVGRLGTKLFDKNVMSREDVVQTLVTTFMGETAREQSLARARAALPPEVFSETVPSEAIKEIIAGVLAQAERLAHCKETAAQASRGSELLSRVCSLTNCAVAAGLPNLARQAKALENLLNQLGKTTQGYTGALLGAVTRCVEIMSRMSSRGIGREQSLTRFAAVVVDEVPLSNRALKEALLNAGFDPVCFEDAARAREHLASNRTELIIVNLRLPEGHSLALRDIRQFPLHTETAVLLGPESKVLTPLDEELPTSAPRLDCLPLLLAELIVRALNAVQSSDKPSAAMAPAAAASQPFDDSVELFEQPAGGQDVVTLDSPVQSAFVPAEAPHQPLRWSAESLTQDNTETIQSEPMLRAQPATAGADRTAEFLASLPATTTDGSLIEEHAVEVSPPSALQAEVPRPPQPEPTMEDQTAAAPWLVASAGEMGQPISARHTASEFQEEDPALFQQSTNTEEVMNHQLQAVPADYSHQVEESQPGEPLSHHQNAEARCAELEQQVASLRQAFADFNGGFDQQQQAVAEAEQRVQELEQRLNQAAVELEKQREEQRRAEADLRRELESANTASRQSEAARQQAQARCAQLEQELGSVSKARQELADKLAREQKAKDEAGASAGDPEHRVRQGVAALARVTAELAKERGERQRSEQRAAELTGRLQGLHEDLRRTLQAQREDLARINALEEQQRQTSQALDQRTADLQQEQAERQLAEEHVEKAKEVNAQLRKDLAFFEEVNKKFGGSRQELQARLEASLGAARENETRLQQENAERQRLAQGLEAAQRELQEQSRKREILEQELQAARDALQNREAALQTESAERQRLSEALNSVRRNSHDGSERDLELTKLQSALEAEQVERKRLETQLAHLRHGARDAAHAARALRTSLRRQIREPADNLVHSTRSLLELELGEAQKKLAEAVLQDVLLVQARLSEPELAHGDTPEAVAPSAITAT